MIIAIDGACRKPGTPECFSIGAYIAKDKSSNKIYGYDAVCESQSTGQRGEILALIQALERCINSDEELIYIVSDSEYVVNCINKEWYKNWENKGWITAEGEEVKNKDLWEIVSNMLSVLEDKEIVVYHINFQSPFYRVFECNVVLGMISEIKGYDFQSPFYRVFECNHEN